MIFSDGECPNCQYPRLSLNTDDLLECPQCHLVSANTDGLIASVMPYLGTGDFRFEDCDLRSMSGVGFAKARPGSVLPEDGAIFQSRADIQRYFEQLRPRQTLSKGQGERLWQEFLGYFPGEVAATDPKALSVAWASKTARTSFYRSTLMPKIASSAKLTYGHTAYRVLSEFIVVL
jgi:hypothetical protein